MPLDKRQIVEVAFPVNDRTEPHPAVVLSVPEVFDQEQYYLCAMLTGNRQEDRFSFFLSNSDTTKELKKVSQVRIHLISQIRESDIISKTPINSLTTDAFWNLINHIDSKVFGISFDLV